MLQSLADTPACLCFVGDGPARKDLERHFAGLPVFFTARRPPRCPRPLARLRPVSTGPSPLSPDGRKSEHARGQVLCMRTRAPSAGGGAPVGGPLRCRCYPNPNPNLTRGRARAGHAEG